METTGQLSNEDMQEQKQRIIDILERVNKYIILALDKNEKKTIAALCIDKDTAINLLIHIIYSEYPEVKDFILMKHYRETFEEIVSDVLFHNMEPSATH
jgi:protein-tyrosine-phosphatase